MGEVRCRRDRRLADIGVDVTGQGAEPGLDRIHRFMDAGEIADLDDFLDEPALFVRRASVFVPETVTVAVDISLPDLVQPSLLQGRIRICGLGGVGMEQGRSLIRHHLLQDAEQ